MESKLLEKYYKGQCSPEEIQQVLDWFESKQLTSTQEQDLEIFWQESEKEKELFTHDSAGILASINKKIDSIESESAEVNKSNRQKQIRKQGAIPIERKWFFKAAAAILLPLCFLWLLTNNLFDGDKAQSKIITTEAKPGVRKTVVLEDGSVITLNSGSSISYLEHFTKHTREIILRGEAFFEVAKDSLRPFIVKTGHISTRAVGTSFNIKYHKKENNISVALASGVVKIEQEATKGINQLARLVPGQQLVFNKAYQSYKIDAYDSLDVLGWREGVLYFKKANLSQVISKLENMYGVDIELTGKVPDEENEWHYTGTYYNESLDNILEGMAFVKSFSYKKTNSRVIIDFN